VLTGHELGTAIRQRYAAPARLSWVPALLAAGIVLGCAAYQAGNLLGAVAGMRLVANLSPALLTAVCGAGAAALLAAGSTRWIATVLGALVAVMGVAFLATAIRLAPTPGTRSTASHPRASRRSVVLRARAVGTTAVPTTSSWLGWRAAAASAKCGGLVLAVGGTDLARASWSSAPPRRRARVRAAGAVLGERPGSGRVVARGRSLAAGFSSAYRRPPPPSLCGRWSGGSHRVEWSERSFRISRRVWLGVLLFGVGFGIAGVQRSRRSSSPRLQRVATAVGAIFLWLTMNDRRLLGDHGVNTFVQNLLMGVIVVACLALGLRGLAAAARGALAIFG
jgi:hypothetical protein